ncbi:MAG: sugar nucleotide-binding protein [Desulfovermiculus sp.]|nr:sugar nucleotide-binding protein [Desulfovermiculus sp.]
MNSTFRDGQGWSDVTGIPGRVLVLGQEQGLLGPALVHCLKASGCEVLPEHTPQADWNVRTWCRELERLEPDMVVNTLAFTHKHQAEQDPNSAFYWNKELPCALARALRKYGLGLVSFSSDCVFDGRQQVAYKIDDQPNPASVCGQSFLAGERALQDIGLENLLIVRTSWVFGPFGSNFVDWVLEQGQQCRCLEIVHDQIGSPTYSMDLASYVLRLVAGKVTGIHHVCNSGQASWCELAAETLNACGFQCSVQAITSGSKSVQSPRLAFCVLDSKQSLALAGTKARPWPQALREYIFTFHPQQVQSAEEERKRVL